MGGKIETMNDQAVGVKGDQIVVLNPKFIMTHAEALRQAAYLVSSTGKPFEEFEKVYDAVCNC